MDILALKRMPLLLSKLTFGLGFFCLLSTSSLAQDDQDTNSQQVGVSEGAKETLLIASPNTCEIDKGVYLCEMKAALIWEAGSQGTYCLFEQEVSVPVKCWESAWQGSYVLDFKSDKSVQYHLKRLERLVPVADGPIVTQATISVIGTLEQRIRAKRRRRLFRIF